MLFWYLLALALGGTLVVASVFFAAFGDAPEADHDGDGGDHDDGDADAVQVWFPYASLRFWTFYLAFGGLTGALLTWMGVGGPSFVVLLIAIAVGYVTGAGATGLVMRLQKRQTDSAVAPEDLEGATGKVMLAVGPGRTGKVRLQLKGRTIERLAETQEKRTFDRNEEVLVYAVREDGRVLVAPN